LATGPRITMYVQWTRNGSSLSGSLTQASLNSKSVQTQNLAFTGTVSGSNVTLVFAQGFGTSTDLTGTVSGSQLTLNVPQDDGTLATDTLVTASPAAYNKAVTALQQQATQASAAAQATPQPTASTPTSAVSAPTNPDLSGTYSDLVTRASGYYEQGAPYVSSGNFTAAAPWFAAAAKVLQAAWDKQPGDPGVGTDLANSLFYAGNIQGAITQIDAVLKGSPNDQAALLDKGNFVNMAGQMDKQAGQTAHANAEIAEAKQLYQQAIKIDPTSANGKAAATQLKSL
jgi:tetratricopeptide (TPR) repeat protein